MDRGRWLAVLVTLAATAASAGSDVPCAALAQDDSFVCVCNATYCDTVTRAEPAAGRYVAYTSTKAGLRFQKSSGKIIKISNKLIRNIVSSPSLRVVIAANSSSELQTVEGFGAAVTDSAGINWKALSTATQQRLIDCYFSASGIEYNMVRVPVGGSDFSTHPYAYNELPRDDPHLTNYTLSTEDYEYKLPMLHSLQSAATSEVHVVATVWSPPTWMKTNNAFYGFSRLKQEYYQTYADYHLKFLELYEQEGVNVWAITTTNEPLNGVIPIARFNSLGWTPATQSQWIIDHLGPTIRSSRFKDTKILGVDDQRYTVPVWFHGMVKHNASVLEYVDGVAVHFYGDFMPAGLISWLHDHYPDKFIIGTEACEGSMPWQLKKVVLGSWARAEDYILDILQDLNHWMVGWMDWNMCLNIEGGPNWANNYVDSPIITFPDTDQFYKNPMFYALGHFSKFIPRGSKRVETTLNSLMTLDHVAFKTSRGTLVYVLYNSGSRKNVDLLIDGDKQITLQIEAKAVMTIELLL